MATILWGWGLHQFQYVSGTQKYSHSNYAELMANHGMLGLILFYSIYFSMYRLYVKTRKVMPVYVRFFLISLVVTSLLWDIAAVSYQTTSTWIVFGVILGVLMRYSQAASADYGQRA